MIAAIILPVSHMAGIPVRLKPKNRHLMHWNLTRQPLPFLATLWVACFLACAGGAGAQTSEPTVSAPVLLEAQQVGYDKNNALVIARGGVEVVQGQYLLLADRIVYFQNQNLVRAEGNVTLLQPNGDVFFADQMDLKDDLKTGVIQNFRARLADNAVFASREAKRLNPYQVRLKKAAYTPCKLCEGKDPFWQITANKVFIDDIDEKVTHQDATLSMLGVPVFYSPYLSHPTPKAGAKSGFLVPEYQAGQNLGTVVKVPYYWRIAPDKQATITPWYTGEGALLQADYQQLFDDGYFNSEVSGTNPDAINSQGQTTSGQEFRGHLYAQGSREFAPNWRYGFDVARTTDDTYLRRYGFGDQNALFSTLFVEGARRRNFASANGLVIQGLQQANNSDATPLVLPTLEGYYETSPYASGLRLHTYANAQSLTREEGVDQQRLSLTVGGNMPYISEGGQVFTFTGNLRGDFYDTQNLAIKNSTETFDGTTTRAIPQGAVEWRYPLIRQIEEASLVIEPTILGVVQPYSGNTQDISNEDNNLLELTDTNLFTLNRMTGLDTIDTGPRLAYGLRSQYLMSDGRSVEMLLGQNYSFDADTPFPNSTTPGEHLSDYIGRVAASFGNWNVGYLFAAEPSRFSLNRNELTGDFAWQWLSLSAAYLSIDQNQYLDASEEAYGSASVNVYGGWSLFGGARQDLLTDELIASNGGVVYRNDCFDIIFDVLRNNTRDRDIEPSTTFALRVGFKNLGEFGANP